MIDTQFFQPGRQLGQPIEAKAPSPTIQMIRFLKTQQANARSVRCLREQWHSRITRSVRGYSKGGRGLAMSSEARTPLMASPGAPERAALGSCGLVMVGPSLVSIWTV